MPRIMAPPEFNDNVSRLVGIERYAATLEVPNELRSVRNWSSEVASVLRVEYMKLYEAYTTLKESKTP